MSLEKILTNVFFYASIGQFFLPSVTQLSSRRISRNDWNVVLPMYWAVRVWCEVNGDADAVTGDAWCNQGAISISSEP